jgi:TfoX/Sxy family transcriptional regulator of competence genes
MPDPLIAKLEQRLKAAADGLTHVTAKKMFGCYALWAKGNVFAMVWKHGRIGFKLADDASYQALLDSTGAEPWKAGSMQMAHWVLVPKPYHDKPSELRKWCARAHDQCSCLISKG